MPGARWDTLSGALNFSVLLLISFILIGPKPSLAFLSEEPAWSKSLQSTRCEAGRALPDNVHAYLEFAHPCLENLPAGMQLLKGDMFAMSQRLNEVRAENGLPELYWHEGAADVARLHAIDMLRRDYMDHESPEGMRSSDRIQFLFRDESFGYTGENLAWFRDAFPPVYDELTLQKQLENSPSHYKAMLNPDYDHVGLAIVKMGSSYMAVQIFLSVEGDLLRDWPDKIYPGDRLKLPSTMNGRAVEGWRLELPDGETLASGYNTEVVVPDVEVDQPVELYIRVAISQTQLLLIKGPVADLISHAP
ncbi:MAG: hypothetical protein CMK09_02490 [Ponticaulis sp.]|nr:hypothetical protein [Ponticaulis sp.]|tara:strand:- start:5802 stop:6716 length:915 start_codon:yes stop_codon:yes gene_type:complete